MSRFEGDVAHRSLVPRRGDALLATVVGLALGLGSTGLRSQITVTATSGATGIAGTPVAGGADVTAGFSHPSAVFSLSSSSQESTAAFSGVVSGLTGFLTTAGGSIRLRYRSQVPTFVDIELSTGPDTIVGLSPFAPTWCGGLQESFSSATVVGMGSTQSGTRTFTRVPVDANGVVVTLQVNVTASAGTQGACGFVTSSSQCSAVVRQSSDATAFGSTCGATLTASRLLDGGYSLDVADPANPQFGVLLVGARRSAVMLPWNCTLWCDFFAALPIQPNAQGALVLSGLEVPSGQFTMQAGRFGPTPPNGLQVIHMTNGVEWIVP